MPGVAQATPTWLAPGSFPGGLYQSSAMNDAGAAAVSFWTASGSDAVVRTSLHTPGSPGFADPLATSPLTGGNSSQGTAINARGDVVVGWSDGIHTWMAIRPAGGSFGAPIDLGPPLSLGTVRVGITDGGDVVAAWMGTDPSYHWTVYWIVKPAGGPVGPLGTVVLTSSTTGDSPRLGMNPAGDAVVAWTQWNGSHWIVRAASRPAGGSFGSPVPLSDPSRDSDTPSPAVSDDGGAAILWKSFDGSSSRLAQISRRATAAADFGLPVDLSKSGTLASDPALAINASGRLLATWTVGGDVQARTGPLTGSFGPTVTFGPTSSPPRAALSDSGAAIVVWSSDTQVLASSHPAGGAFDTPFVVTPEGETITSSMGIPTATAALDAGDDMLVVWNGTSKIGYRVYDAAGPRLGDVAVPGTATAGQAASFSVTPLDAFSAIASTHWDFGDGSSADGASVSHTYNSAGSYTVKVTATDAVGNATSDTKSITVASAPVSPPPPAPPTPPAPPKVMCKVPNLKGSTLAKAKKKLTAAHCKLGKVTTPKKLRKAKGLVILKQLPKAGTTKAEGFKVSVTLGKKPKARRR